MIRVVVIDDSAFMRKALSIMLENDSEIKIVGTARDGAEGFEKVKELRPDVVTLDIEMPRTNGLDCLKMIMKEIPTPVLVVSSVSTEGAEVTLKALELGALDFIPKSQSFVAIDIVKIQDELTNKIKQIAKKSYWSKIQYRAKQRQARIATEVVQDNRYLDLSLTHLGCVAIGVSTGGPPVVQKILESLPEDFPLPIVIAQHMPKEFTRTFADRLNTQSKIYVKEAETGDVLQRGTAYIGRGGKHLVIRRQGVRVIGFLEDDPKDLLYHPSADVLFSSVTESFGSATLGLILTGMGKDGVLGLGKLREKGGKILAQNEETCVVYGMPKAAVDANLTDGVFSVEGIIKSLLTIRKK